MRWMRGESYDIAVKPLHPNRLLKFPSLIPTSEATRNLFSQSTDSVKKKISRCARNEAESEVRARFSTACQRCQRLRIQLECAPPHRRGATRARRSVRAEFVRSLSTEGTKVSTFTSPKVEAIPSSCRRRCYGAAVEAALAPIRYDPAASPSAPRLQELLSQLDADGHDTTALRQELGQLLDVVGLVLPARNARTPLLLVLRTLQISADHESQRPEALALSIS